MVLYYLGIRLYSLAIFIASIFNTKAKKLTEGRKNTWKILGNFNRIQDKPLAWFHCASLGEFEQARPVIERLKRERDIQIVVSFFSPSGYEVRKNYPLADLVFYLPADTTYHAKQLLKALSPQMVFFVKYEIWLRLINQISSHGIPLYLLSATFRPKHIYFKWYGQLFKKALIQFKVIFTQDTSSTLLLKQHGLNNVVWSNDTRYDRVYDTCQQTKPLPLIETFAQQELVLILGSSYAQEEQLALGFLKQLPELNVKLIIAPHEISATRIAHVMGVFEAYKPIRYSEINVENAPNAQVLIIDNVGLLASLYAYAHMALIGGGFGSKGIHNTLEAATFGMPILIGPNNQERFPETTLLKEAGVLYTINNQLEVNELLNAFSKDSNRLQQIKQQSQQFIRQNIGATDVIIAHL